MKASTAKHLAMGPKDKQFVRAGELFEQFTAAGLSSAPWLDKVCRLHGKKKRPCCKKEWTCPECQRRTTFVVSRTGRPVNSC